MERLFEWVKVHGGETRVEPREDKVTGVRGLYASEDITDPNLKIIRIPNNLIISPHHIKHQKLG